MVIYLGNIRQTHIKNIAIELAKKYPDQFSAEDFQLNKEKVVEYVNIDSKWLRNRIAGYVTRYLSSQQRGKSRPISE